MDDHTHSLEDKIEEILIEGGLNSSWIVNTNPKLVEFISNRIIRAATLETDDNTIKYEYSTIAHKYITTLSEYEKFYKQRVIASKKVLKLIIENRLVALTSDSLLVRTLGLLIKV